MNTAIEKKHLTIHHQPYGEQHPYDFLPTERFPRNPCAGEPVLLGVETNSYPEADSVWCLWQVEGNSDENRTEAVKVNSTESTHLWQINLPAFNGNEFVHYRFFGQSGYTIVESERFSFSVSTWINVSSVNSLEETENQILLELSTASPNLNIHLEIESNPNGNLSFYYSQASKPLKTPSKACSEQRFSKTLENVQITIETDPFNLRLERESDGLLLESTKGPLQVLVGADGKVLQYRFAFESPSDEAFYGFGARYNALNQRGNLLDNHVYNQYTSQKKRTYIPIPFFISSRTFGFWLNSKQQAQFDLAAVNDDCWTATGHAEEDQSSIELQFFLQEHPHKIIRTFTDITGKPKLPPHWAFGLWMSSNDWNSQNEINRQLALAKQYQIPATVMVIEAWSDETNFYIWNDAEYRMKPSSQAYTLNDYTFPEKGLWPDPKTLIDEIHHQGMRLVLWQIPVMKANNPNENYDETQKDADQAYAIEKGFVVQKADGSPHQVEAHAPWFCRSLVFDFTHPEAVEWWFKKRQYLLDELGVDGFKTDGGEHIWATQTRFHNGMRGSQGINDYPVSYLEAYDRFLSTHLGDDHILFSRAGYTGVQQVSSHWAGDENSTWEAFQATINSMLNVGMCGVSFMGWDIAGFAGPIPTSELYLRAAAFSIFCPIMQYHSDYNGRRKPSRDRTPWNIQERTGDSNVIPIFRKFTNLRMNLLPYLLAQANESSQSGIPLMRALAIEFPADQTCRKYPYEYLFGDALLIAPVVKEGYATWNVYLPEGEWWAFWSDEIYTGPQFINVPSPMDHIPVFQRKGSILPLNLGKTLEICSPVGSATNEITNLTLSIFPGTETQIELQQGSDKPIGQVSAKLDLQDQSTQIELKNLEVTVDLLILGNTPEKVFVNQIQMTELKEDGNHSDTYWVCRPDLHAVHLHLPGNQNNISIVLK
jgi:alpha-glucosidase (family GH31 glycosyl hydrolase)